MPVPSQLTDRQEKWFASVRAGLESQTGKTIEQWAEIARLCPEEGHRQRLRWMKAEHGLGQNHASLILKAAFPQAVSWDEPDALAQILWADPASRAIFDAIAAAATTLPDVIVGQRKSFSPFSRKVQFAAARPVKGGGVLLGLALDPDVDERLEPVRRESWSERLKSCVALARVADVDAGLAALLKMAWERS